MCSELASGAPADGAIWMAGGGVRSSVGDGATMFGPGCWLGAGGGNWNSVPGVGCGAVCATWAGATPSVAAVSAEVSTARLVGPTGAQAVARASRHARATAVRWTMNSLLQQGGILPYPHPPRPSSAGPTTA